jgi:hypothetical protein
VVAVSADFAHNLVLAERKSDGQKRDRIAAVSQLAAWRKRNDVFGTEITVAMASRVPCDSNAATRIAYWAYEQTEAIGGLCWLRADELVHLTAEWRSLLA